MRLFSKAATASKAHLIKKQIVNKRGHRQTVYVRSSNRERPRDAKGRFKALKKKYGVAPELPEKTQLKQVRNHIEDEISKKRQEKATREGRVLMGNFDITDRKEKFDAFLKQTFAEIENKKAIDSEIRKFAKANNANYEDEDEFGEASSWDNVKFFGSDLGDIDSEKFNIKLYEHYIENGGAKAIKEFDNFRKFVKDIRKKMKNTGGVLDANIDDKMLNFVLDNSSVALYFRAKFLSTFKDFDDGNFNEFLTDYKEWPSEENVQAHFAVMNKALGLKDVAMGEVRKSKKYKQIMKNINDDEIKGRKSIINTFLDTKAYTESMFDFLGVKKVRIYRGFEKDYDKGTKWEKKKISTRTFSSFSENIRTARSFAASDEKEGFVCAKEAPIKDLFYSFRFNYLFGNSHYSEEDSGDKFEEEILTFNDRNYWDFDKYVGKIKSLAGKELRTYDQYGKIPTYLIKATTKEEQTEMKNSWEGNILLAYNDNWLRKAQRNKLKKAATASKAHLIKKQIVNKRGHRQTVWVLPKGAIKETGAKKPQKALQGRGKVIQLRIRDPKGRFIKYGREFTAIPQIDIPMNIKPLPTKIDLKKDIKISAETDELRITEGTKNYKNLQISKDVFEGIKKGDKESLAKFYEDRIIRFSGDTENLGFLQTYIQRQEAFMASNTGDFDINDVVQETALKFLLGKFTESLQKVEHKKFPGFFVQSVKNVGKELYRGSIKSKAEGRTRQGKTLRTLVSLEAMTDKKGEAMSIDQIGSEANFVGKKRNAPVDEDVLELRNTLEKNKGRLVSWGDEVKNRIRESTKKGKLGKAMFENYDVKDMSEVGDRLVSAWNLIYYNNWKPQDISKKVGIPLKFITNMNRNFGASILKLAASDEKAPEALKSLRNASFSDLTRTIASMVKRGVLKPPKVFGFPMLAKRKMRGKRGLKNITGEEIKRRLSQMPPSERRKLKKAITLLKAATGRAGLIQKQIINKEGKKQTVWVRPGEKPTGEKQGAQPQAPAKGGANMREMIRKDPQKRAQFLDLIKRMFNVIEAIYAGRGPDAATEEGARQAEDFARKQGDKKQSAKPKMTPAQKEADEIRKKFKAA